jgi:hypothetical protein
LTPASPAQLRVNAGHGKNGNESNESTRILHVSDAPYDTAAVQSFDYADYAGMKEWGAFAARQS